MTAHPARVNQAELARMLGVSRQAIGDLIARGLLTQDADGLIDAEQARIELANNVRPSSKTAQALGTAVVPPADASTPPAAGPTDAAAATSYHVARTINEAAEAQLKQLKLAKVKKELFNTAEAMKAWAGLLAQVRERAEQIPARVVPMQIAAAIEGNHARVYDLLVEELKLALDELSSAPQRLLEAIGESLE